MDTAIEPGEKSAICQWCSTSQAAGHFCTNCKGPRSRLGKMLFSANLVLKLLAVPASLLFISYELSIQQQAASQSRDDQQRLVAAYSQFAEQMADLSAAEADIKLLALSAQDVPKKDVQAAISETDRSFVAIGAKLTPFEVVEAPDLHLKSPLQAVWEKCFSYSYYAERGRNTKEDGYRKQMTDLVASCPNGGCPVEKVRAIGNVLWKMQQQSSCHDLSGVPKRDFGWIWHHLGLEISCARSPDVAACSDSRVMGAREP